MNRVTLSKAAGEAQRKGKVSDEQWKLVKVAATLAGMSASEYCIMSAVEKAEATLGRSLREMDKKAGGR